MENTQKKVNVNFAVKIVGFLAHDNNLFDRTCSACKGMYSSFEHSTCPKCGAGLVYITTKKGHAMSISEGTIYPAIGDQENTDKTDITKRKNGLLPKYRFKVFGFASDAGAPPIPDNHMHMKKGALVKIIVIDHQFISSWFNGKEGLMVELMMNILTYKGDTVEVIKAPKAVAEQTVAQAVLPDGTVAPVDATLNADNTALAHKDAQIAALKAQLAAMGAGNPTPAPEQPVATPVTNPAPSPVPDEVVVNHDSVDPFALVSC